MMTLTNELITLPFRHELAKRIQAELGKRKLAARDFNRLTEEIWKAFFADTTQNFDEYIWAYKRHFYMMRPFYDFQYTFGFLVSRQLLAQLAESGDGTLYEHFFSRSRISPGRKSVASTCRKISVAPPSGRKPSSSLPSP